MENQEPIMPLEMEGLVLRDGDGAFYEVPRVVIERYRVTEERAAELTAELPADMAPVSLTLAWRVTSAVYASRVFAARAGQP
jgi:hypothetical protein